MREGSLDIQTTTAIIGIGAYTAEPALHFRGQAANTDWRLALYNVYEAKRMAEQSPFVGRGTRLYIIDPPDEHSRKMRVSIMTAVGNNFAQGLIEQFGPKKMIEYPDWPLASFGEPVLLA
jgi:hypothetical protein